MSEAQPLTILDVAYDVLSRVEEPLSADQIAMIARSEAGYLKLARAATIAWCAVLFAVGLQAQSWGSVLKAGLSIASVIYGGLLGVFLLGVLTRRAGEIAAILGMIAGLGSMIFVKFGTSIAWTWYVLIGTSITFATGILASFFFKGRHVND